MIYEHRARSKEEESGGRVVFVDHRGMSQRCSGCGEKVVKSLSDRVHERARECIRRA